MKNHKNNNNIIISTRGISNERSRKPQTSKKTPAPPTPNPNPDYKPPIGNK